MIDLNQSDLEGDYEVDANKLGDRIRQLPVISIFKGWIFYTFKRLDEEGLIRFDDEEGLGFKGNKLILSEERKGFISKGYLWNELYSYFEDILRLLPIFHMKYKSQYSFRMAKMYSFFYLYLRGVIDANNLNRYSTNSNGLDLKELMSNCTEQLDRLNQELLNLLEDLNYGYKEFEDELMIEFQESSTKFQTYNLINESRFKDNFEEIYSKLVPDYLNESTTKEDLRTLFAGGQQQFKYPLKWMQNPNHLNYFVKLLRERGKISNGHFYKIAQEVFVDIEGNPFNNLKNNHSKPKDFYKINIIVDLF